MWIKKSTESIRLLIFTLIAGMTATPIIAYANEFTPENSSGSTVSFIDSEKRNELVIGKLVNKDFTPTTSMGVSLKGIGYTMTSQKNITLQYDGKNYAGIEKVFTDGSNTITYTYFADNYFVNRLEIEFEDRGAQDEFINSLIDNKFSFSENDGVKKFDKPDLSIISDGNLVTLRFILRQAPVPAFKTKTIKKTIDTDYQYTTVLIDFPVQGDPTLLKNIRKDINELLGGSYSGPLDNSEKMLSYYSREGLDGQTFKATVSWQNNKCVTYDFEYEQGAGGISVYSKTYLKSNGQTFSKSCFTSFRDLKPILNNGEFNFDNFSEGGFMWIDKDEINFGYNEYGEYYIFNSKKYSQISKYLNAQGKKFFE